VRKRDPEGIREGPALVYAGALSLVRAGKIKIFNIIEWTIPK